MGRKEQRQPIEEFEIEQSLDRQLEGLAAVERVDKLDEGIFQVVLTYAIPTEDAVRAQTINPAVQAQATGQYNTLERLSPPVPMPPSFPSGEAKGIAPAPARPVSQQATMAENTVAAMGKVRARLADLRAAFEATDPRDPNHHELALQIKNGMSELNYLSADLLSTIPG